MIGLTLSLLSGLRRVAKAVLPVIARNLVWMLNCSPSRSTIWILGPGQLIRRI